jgi:hypothetical protein
LIQVIPDLKGPQYPSVEALITEITNAGKVIINFNQKIKIPSNITSLINSKVL